MLSESLITFPIKKTGAHIDISCCFIYLGLDISSLRVNCLESSASDSRLEIIKKTEIVHQSLDQVSPRGGECIDSIIERCRLSFNTGYVIQDVRNGLAPRNSNARGKEDKRLEVHVQIAKINDLKRPQHSSLYSHQNANPTQITGKKGFKHRSGNSSPVSSASTANQVKSVSQQYLRLQR